MTQSVDLDVLYNILKLIAETSDIITYEQLSEAYRHRTRDDVHRRQWGSWLGEVSGRCTSAGLPPISTVVVSQTDNLPGDGYWGIAGSPPNKDYNDWKIVCNQVYKAHWPKTLP
jgi:hypothetical protein